MEHKIFIRRIRKIDTPALVRKQLIQDWLIEAIAAFLIGGLFWGVIYLGYIDVP